MRVLCVSHCGSPVTNDPYLAMLLSLMKGMEGKPVWFDLLLPEPGKSFVYDHEISGPNFRVIYMPEYQIRMIAEVCPSQELYRFLNVRTSELVYDCVLNERVAFGPVLKKYVKAKTRQMSVDVPVFHFVNMVMDPAYGLPEAYGEDEVLSQVLNVFGDYVIVLNQLEKDRLIRLCREYLKPSRSLEAEKRIAVADVSGMNVEKVCALAREGVVIRERRFTVMYAGRFNHVQKRFDLILEAFEQLFSVHPEWRYLLTSPEDEDVSELQVRYPFEFFSGVPRDEFHRNCGRADVFFYASSVESFCMTAAEMLVAGMAGVFLDREWVRKLYGDVPFIAKDVKEAVAMICMIEWQSRDRSVELSKLFRPAVTRLINMKGNWDAVYEFMSSKVDALLGEPGEGSMTELIRSALVPPMPESVLYQQMTSLSESNRLFGKRGDIMNRFWLRRCVLRAGFKDLCDGPEPVYVMA